MAQDPSRQTVGTITARQLHVKTTRPVQAYDCGLHFTEEGYIVVEFDTSPVLTMIQRQ